MRQVTVFGGCRAYPEPGRACSGFLVEWDDFRLERDLRGLTPLFWVNVLLHGVFALDLAKRLDYDRVPTADDLDDVLGGESDGDELVSASQH